MKTGTKHPDAGKWAMLAFTSVVFTMLAAVTFYLGDVVRAPIVFPDELRYWDLFRNIVDGTPWTLLGEPADYQKIGAPLSWLPAALFDGTQAQIRAILALNAVYGASSLFPILMFARRLFGSYEKQIACVVVGAFMTLPVTCYMFMAEAVFLPLALWFLYACWRMLDAPDAISWKWAGIGALAFALYLVKEIGVIFLAAFLLVSLFSCWKDEGRRLGRGLACAGLAVCGFAVPFAAAKLVVFSGMPNSYVQVEAALLGLGSAYTVMYGLFWALPANMALLTLGLYVLPVAAPFFEYRGMGRSEKHLTSLCLVSFALLVLAVTFSVTMVENLGFQTIDVHCRYFYALLFPLMMLCAKCLWDEPSEAIRPSKTLVVSASVALALLMAFFIGHARTDSLVEPGPGYILGLALGVEAPGTFTSSYPGFQDVGGAVLSIHPVAVGMLVFAVGGLVAYAVSSSRLYGRARKRVNSVLVALVAGTVVLSCVAYHETVLATSRCYGGDVENAMEMMEEASELAYAGNDVAVVLPTNAIGKDEQDTKHEAVRTLLLGLYQDNADGHLKYVHVYGDQAWSVDIDARPSMVPIDLSGYDYLVAASKYDSAVIPDGAEAAGTWSFHFEPLPADGKDASQELVDVSIYKLPEK